MAISLTQIQGTDSISSSRLVLNQNFTTIESSINSVAENSRIKSIIEDTNLTLSSAAFTNLASNNLTGVKSLEFNSPVKGIVIPQITSFSGTGATVGSLGMSGPSLYVHNGTVWTAV